MLLKPGTIIRFTYDHRVRDAATGDRYKEVLVLHPHWRGRLHGIDLKRLTPAEREVLEVIMTWDRRKHRDGQPHRIPLVNDILKRMDPRKEVFNPVTFYAKFVKPFLNRRDAYRMYYPGQMTGVTIAKDIKKKVEQRPLFGKKPEPKEQEPKIVPTDSQKPLSSAQQRLAMLKAKMTGRPIPSPTTVTPAPSRPLQPGVVKTTQGPSAVERLAMLKAKMIKK